jgi:hypothetical protein
MCREQERDYREYDFYTMVDSNLNYYENLAELDNQLGQSETVKEKEAANKLKDYLTEEQLNEYSATEKNVIEEVQTTNKTLQKKIGQITKKLEAQQNQQIDPEQLKHELEEMTRVQTLIYAKLEQLPNLDQQISALLQSSRFQDLGRALQPIKPSIKEPSPEKPNKPKLSGLSVWLKRKQIKLLDAFAGAVTSVIWLAVSGWVIQAFGLTYLSVIGLAVFWLGFIVVFRLMIGGILD